MRSTILFFALALLSAVCVAEPVDFNHDIRPILSNNCFHCHGPDEEEIQSGLRLDERESAISDSDSGIAIVPGAPNESLLIERILAKDTD